MFSHTWYTLEHRELECLDDAQGYANPGPTMLDRLGQRVQTNRDATCCLAGQAFG